MPTTEQSTPKHLQVARYYKQQILTGELHEGDRLPSLRAMREAWRNADGSYLGFNVFQRAVEHLASERLIRTEPREGAFVAPPRAAIGPQQRLLLTASPQAYEVTVTAAGLVPCPAYILPILGLEEGDDVIRREEVTRYADGRPHMLSVTWCSPLAALPVPELLQQVPLPDPRGAGPLIAERSGRELSELKGGVAFECRRAKEDGRELVHLQMAPGEYVLAGVSGWRDGEESVEYTEFVMPPNTVVEAEFTAA